jgi:hypothetical protein
MTQHRYQIGKGNDGKVVIAITRDGSPVGGMVLGAPQDFDVIGLADELCGALDRSRRVFVVANDAAPAPEAPPEPPIPAKRRMPTLADPGEDD